MLIRRRQKKRNAEPRQNPKHRHPVIDPLVNPRSPPHRHQARPKADPTRTHHRMVTLAQSSPGRRPTGPLQKTTTVMLANLRAAEARHEPTIAPLCDAYLAEKAAKSTTEQRRGAAR